MIVMYMFITNIKLTNIIVWYICINTKLKVNMLFLYYCYGRNWMHSKLMNDK